MSHQLFLVAGIAALALVACTTAPLPQPVDDEKPPSARETADAAADAADDPRGVLYATSRPDDEEPAIDEDVLPDEPPEENDEDEVPGVDEDVQPDESPVEDDEDVDGP